MNNEEALDALTALIASMGVPKENATSWILIAFEATKESDRGMALFVTAALDDALTELLRAYFVSDKKVANELLGRSRPLASFSSRIDMAFLLGQIDKLVRRDLHLMRDIRNSFAHSASVVSFADQNIANQCKELVHAGLAVDGSPRDMYFAAAAHVLGAVVGRKELLVLKPELAAQERVSPFSHDLKDARREVTEIAKMAKEGIREGFAEYAQTLDKSAPEKDAREGGDDSGEAVD